MLPPPPARFSTTTCCPHRSPRRLPRMRAKTSKPPPGAAGTMIRTLCDGNGSCAHAQSAANTRATSRAARIIGLADEPRDPEGKRRQVGDDDERHHPEAHEGPQGARLLLEGN